MAIRFENVSKSFENQKVLENISLELPETGTIGVFGQSGIGKTTFINILIGLIKPDLGKVIVKDNLKFSVVFQEDRLLEWFTAGDNVLAVNDNSAYCETLLKELEIFDYKNKYPNELSGGMRRRAALARALAYEGDVFVFDEALKGLDTGLKRNIMSVIKQRVSGRLSIFISHDEFEISQLCDYFLLFENKPVASAEIRDVRNLNFEEKQKILIEKNQPED